MQDPPIHTISLNSSLFAVMVSLFGARAARAYDELNTLNRQAAIRTSDTCIRELITRRAVKHRLGNVLLHRDAFVRQVDKYMGPNREELQTLTNQLSVAIEHYQTMRQTYPEKRLEIRMLCYGLSFDFQQISVMIA